MTDDWLTVLHGDNRDVLPTLEAESVHCVVTSPPYWGLRDYGVDGQLGLEKTPEEYVSAMVGVFREVKRVLRSDGTLWLNLGDSYAGSWGAQSRGNFPSEKSTLRGTGPRPGEKYSALSATQIHAAPKGDHTGSWVNDHPSLKPKDLVGIPWRVAFALQADGWYLRSDIIWSKPNPMPESVADRPTKSHEYLFLLTKSPTYWYDSDAVRETASPASIARISQPNFANQTGGPKDNRNNPEARQDRSMRTTLENFAANPGRNLRSVWSIATAPYPGAHFATFPPKLVEPCILAGCPEGGTVLDPFAGTGTVGMVAQKLSRRAVLIDLNGDYLDQLRERNAQMPAGLVA